MVNFNYVLEIEYVWFFINIDEDVDSIDMIMDIDIGWRYLFIYR